MYLWVNPFAFWYACSINFAWVLSPQDIVRKSAFLISKDDKIEIQCFGCICICIWMILEWLELWIMFLAILAWWFLLLSPRDIYVQIMLGQIPCGDSFPSWCNFYSKALWHNLKTGWNNIPTIFGSPKNYNVYFVSSGHYGRPRGFHDISLYREDIYPK